MSGEDATPEQLARAIAEQTAWTMALSGKPLTDETVQDIEQRVLERLLAADGTEPGR